MIRSLRGILSERRGEQIILEVQGIGYLVFVTAHTMERMPPIGGALFLYTSFVVRESSHTLYGFLSLAELELFELLLDVSGIGPKLALNFTGTLSPNAVAVAIEHKDLTALCRVPGIGKKTAERLIVELRGKMFPFLGLDSTPASPLPILDAVCALVNLGYSQSHAQQAVQKAISAQTPPSTLSELIKCALQQVAR